MTSKTKRDYKIIEIGKVRLYIHCLSINSVLRKFYKVQKKTNTTRLRYTRYSKQNKNCFFNVIACRTLECPASSFDTDTECLAATDDAVDLTVSLGRISLSLQTELTRLRASSGPNTQVDITFLFPRPKLLTAKMLTSSQECIVPCLHQ